MRKFITMLEITVIAILSLRIFQVFFPQQVPDWISFVYWFGLLIFIITAILSFIVKPKEGETKIFSFYYSIYLFVIITVFWLVGEDPLMSNTMIVILLILLLFGVYENWKKIRKQAK